MCYKSLIKSELEIPICLEMEKYLYHGNRSKEIEKRGAPGGSGHDQVLWSSPTLGSVLRREPAFPSLSACVSANLWSLSVCQVNKILNKKEIEKEKSNTGTEWYEDDTIEIKYVFWAGIPSGISLRRLHGLKIIPNWLRHWNTSDRVDLSLLFVTLLRTSFGFTWGNFTGKQSNQTLMSSSGTSRNESILREDFHQLLPWWI